MTLPHDTSSPAVEWRLVPVEPTEEMIDAYFNRCSELGFTAHINATAAWSALLAAAPAREAPSPTGTLATPGAGDPLREALRAQAETIVGPQPNRHYASCQCDACAAWDCAVGGAVLALTAAQSPDAPVSDAGIREQVALEILSWKPDASFDDSMLGAVQVGAIIENCAGIARRGVDFPGVPTPPDRDAPPPVASDGDVERHDMAAALRNTPAEALREAGYLDRAADMLEAVATEPRGCPTPGARSCVAAALAPAQRSDGLDAGLELHGLDTTERVCFYEQDFYVLSNFSAFKIWHAGRTFDTVEQAYHWEKFRDSPAQMAILHAASAHDAFRHAQRMKNQRRADWDDVKLDIMRQLLRAKIDQHEYVRRKLLATGDRELVENSWRDDYWGWGPNRDGQNMLGKLWMELRAELRALSQPEASGEEE